MTAGIFPPVFPFLSLSAMFHSVEIAAPESATLDLFGPLKCTLFLQVLLFGSSQYFGVERCVTAFPAPGLRHRFPTLERDNLKKSGTGPMLSSASRRPDHRNDERRCGISDTACLEPHLSCISVTHGSSFCHCGARIVRVHEFHAPNRSPHLLIKGSHGVASTGTS